MPFLASAAARAFCAAAGNGAPGADSSKAAANTAIRLCGQMSGRRRFSFLSFAGFTFYEKRAPGHLFGAFETDKLQQGWGNICQTTIPDRAFGVGGAGQDYRHDICGMRRHWIAGLRVGHGFRVAVVGSDH